MCAIIQKTCIAHFTTLISLFTAMAEGGDNRRHPHNLQGVLRLAVEAGAAGDGQAPAVPMSEEVNIIHSDVCVALGLCDQTAIV